MANQSPNRRDTLLLLARIAGIGAFPGFSKWVAAAKDGRSKSSEAEPAAYKPMFFSAHEYNTVDIVTEHIIPADGTPGANQAGVAEFIDFMVAHSPDLQYQFRTGLAWLDVFARESNSTDFTSLPVETRQLLLSRLAYHAKQSPAELQGQEFFSLIREYTVLGFYTSRIGLEALDYPGLRIYGSSPECPHKDDPEHRHLGGHAA